jgi:hypothetical protein
MSDLQWDVGVRIGRSTVKQWIKCGEVCQTLKDNGFDTIV